MIIIGLLLIIYMGVMSAMAGGSLFPNAVPEKLKFMPEVFFALGFAIAFHEVTGAGWWSIIVWAWSYAWMQSSHSGALPWGETTKVADRQDRLTSVTEWVCDRLKLPIWYVSKSKKYRTVQYARTYMAIKGFLIGLPVGGIPLAILWPLGYELGQRYAPYKHLNTYREALAGMGAGISILLFTWVL